MSPTASPTPPPTASPTPSPTGPPSGCAAAYRVVGQWQGGFQGEVSVRNSGTAPVSGWTVRFAFADGQRISQSWNAEVAQSGAEVTARNVAWNGALAPGGQVTFGFLGSTAASAAVGPVSCTVA